MKKFVLILFPSSVFAGGGSLNRDSGLIIFLLTLALLVGILGFNYLVANRWLIMKQVFEWFGISKKDDQASD
jgi:hypothetical protein